MLEKKMVSHMIVRFILIFPVAAYPLSEQVASKRSAGLDSVRACKLSMSDATTKLVGISVG